MNMGESFNVQEGAAILLLCARCHEPVKAGDSHKCKEIPNEASNETSEKAEG